MSNMALEFRIHSLILDSFAINRFPNNVDESLISFDVKYSDIINSKNKEISFQILINVFEEHQPEIKLCTIQTTTSYEIINFEELVNEGIISDSVIAHLLGIALSTTRGILFSQSTIASSKQIIFPIITPMSLVEAARNDMNLESIIWQANNYTELKNYNKARELLIKAIEIYSDIDILINNLGLVYGYLEDYDKALECFDQIIKRHPTYIDAYLNKGYILMAMGKYREAIDHYDKALEISPQNQKALINKASIYLKQNKLNEAKALLEFFVAIYPDSAIGFNNLADLYKQSKDYNKALESAFKAIQLDNSLVLAYATVAEIYSELGLKDYVIEYLDKALQLGYPKEKVIEDPSFKKMLHFNEIKNLLNLEEA